MRILVLGGDGFLGSHLVELLHDMGHVVTVFDLFPDDASRNLEHLRNEVRFVQGNVTDKDALKRVLTGHDLVYHFVCLTNPALSWNDPRIEIDFNLSSSLEVFEASVACSVRKVVFPSSGGTVYGFQQGLITEENSPNPANPYGIAKLAIEFFLKYYKNRFGIAADIYRIGNPYGPRQPTDRSQGVIAMWMKKILDGEEVEVCGDENTFRDYVYVKDVAFLMAHSVNDIDSSATYNIGTGKGVSIIELFNVFRRVIDVPFKYKVLERRGFDNASVILDGAKLTSHYPDFQFKPLEEMIRDTWMYMKETYTKYGGKRS
jgi:UDP-glucose 4-epimerase